MYLLMVLQLLLPVAFRRCAKIVSVLASHLVRIEAEDCSLNLLLAKANIPTSSNWDIESVIVLLLYIHFL